MRTERRLDVDRQAVEGLAADLACPVPAMPEHHGASGGSDPELEVLPGVQLNGTYRISCTTCGFVWRVTAHQAKRYLARRETRYG